MLKLRRHSATLTKKISHEIRAVPKVVRLGLRLRTYGRLSTMRGLHAIIVGLVVIALLATPVALLARSTPNDPMQCCGTYCPMRAAQSSQHRKMMCGGMPMSDPTCPCGMRSNHQADYGLSMLMAPTMVSAAARLDAPNSSRRAAALCAEFSLSGSLSDTFHPPRS